MPTAFISDLHLTPERPAIIQTFLSFLQTMAQAHEDTRIDALYILGDLFEAWIGDDASIPLYQPILTQLAQFTQIIPTYFMHGNRDFLIGKLFSQSTGITLLEDPCIIHLYDKKILLSHGDIFCSDDREYQQFRTMVRNTTWQQQFLQKPIAERLAIAQSLRQESHQQKQQKSTEIMDVNTQTVAQYMTQYQVQRLIHGHTHRPADHNEKDYQRLVLGEWYKQGNYLLFSANTHQRIEIC